MNSTRPSGIQFAIAISLLSAGLSLSGKANAEVTILQSDTWQVYTTGRVNAFFSYGFGDADPVPRDGENLPPGGGLSVGADVIPKIGPDGMPIAGAQGTFRGMRVRSGFLPNVFGFGVRRKINEDTSVMAFMAIWATIESRGGRKADPVIPDAREGYLKVESHRWGTLTAGRALDLFSRGATENDFLYGHGYSLGFPGNIDSGGPTAGLIGFGVLAAFFSPGIMYATPSLAGAKLSVGVYDPTPLQGFYEATRDVRPEAELTYDLSSGNVKMHLFGNGGYQTFYTARTNSTAAYGVGYGGRLEVGPAHLGIAGHYGKGLGLQYAFQNGDVMVGPAPNLELRFFDGYSVFGQYVLGPVDLNVGWGMSRVLQLDSDKVLGANISLPTQWAVSAAVVYHATDYLHLDIDYLRGEANWTLAEKQVMNFINTGITVTW